MLLILRSTALSWASTSAFPVLGVSVMEAVPEPVEAEPEPVPVVAVPPDVAPLEFAVPTEFVPGGGGDAALDALPAPLGSLIELLRPPALAGPDGTPLVADVPAPAEPALGVLAAEPAPADAPALPLAPPALPPPALPPPPPPPELCANALMGNIRIAAATRVARIERLVIEISLSISTSTADAGSERRNKFGAHRLDVG
jgi:hypothetical protein